MQVFTIVHSQSSPIRSFLPAGRAIVNIFMVLFLLFPFSAYAGSLDSPAAPTAAGSAMYTLTDIYNRLNAGTAGAKRSGAFTEPSAGPTAGTGKTLDEVMGKAPTVDDTNGASASDVLSGKTYWGLTSGGWGTQTGTLATQTLSADSTTVSAGTYAATTLDAVDADLAAANIKSGVTIFGVAGGLSGGVTCTGTLNGTRWCDNGDGTVTDLTTGLIWLQAADWGGLFPFWDATAGGTGTNAHDKAASLAAGAAGAGLSDGSAVGDWRTPTKKELNNLANSGTEDVSSASMRAFTGVQTDNPYWTSTTEPPDPDAAWTWSFAAFLGGSITKVKTNPFYVWPVRGP